MRQFWLGCVFLCGCSCLADGDDFTVVPDGGDTDSAEADSDMGTDTQPDMDEGCSEERPCPELAGQDGVCTPGGLCRYECSDGFGECDGDRSTCEDLQSDPENCGQCNRRCDSGVCTDGRCDNVDQVVLGFGVGCTRRATGRVDCWGPNLVGQVGVGNELPQYEPVALERRFAQISAGRRGVCGLDRETMRPSCWGAGAFGGVDGENAASPREVISEDSAEVFDTRTFADIDLLLEVACAVDDMGEVWCWGQGQFGALGNGTAEGGRSAAPVLLEDGETARFVDVEVGISHACALTDDGRLFCWGFGGDGRVGAGTEGITAPTEVLDGVSAFSVGRQNTCAIQDAVLLCWGPSTEGQLGRADDVLEPTEIELPLEGDVDEVAVGFQVVLARVGERWFGAGSTRFAQLPIAAEDVPDAAFAELPLIAGFRGIDFGFTHGCAIEAGEPRCWGADFEGELRSRPMIHTTPVRVDLDMQVVSLHAGVRHACAIVEAGDEQRLVCWGDNDSSQLPGVSSVGALGRPTLAGSSDVRAASVGLLHTCFATADGVRCVGGNNFRQAGVGLAGPIEIPTLIDMSTMVVADTMGLASGLRHVCAYGLSSWCWGSNSRGELGLEPSVEQPPTRVFPSAQRIDLGRLHGCAQTGSRVGCFGSNGSGQLGADTERGPITVPGLDEVTDLSTGSFHTCIINGGNVHCWGSNTGGQADPSSVESTVEPVTVPLPQVATLVAAGERHSCAVGADRVYCWGSNDRGQLGRGDMSPGPEEPFTVAEVRNIRQFDAGFGEFTLAVDAEGRAWCWGEDLYGVCGTGAALLHETPAPLGRRE